MQDRLLCALLHKWKNIFKLLKVQKKKKKEQKSLLRHKTLPNENTFKREEGVKIFSEN